MHLYSFAQFGKTNYLLGTVHSYPFERLSEKVREFFLSKNTLCTEHSSVKWGDVAGDWGLINQTRQIPDVAFSVIEFLKAAIHGIKCAVTFNIPKEQLELIESDITSYARDWGINPWQLSPAGVRAMEHLVQYKDGIDSVLVRRSSAKLSYLESTEVVQNALGGNVLSMMMSMACWRCSNDGLGEMAQMYEDGFLYASLMKTMSAEPQIYRDRNVKFLQGDGHQYLGILKISSTQSDILVAVGMGHLFGDNGLLRRLIENGYEIKRLDDTLCATHFTVDDLNEIEAKSFYCELRSLLHDKPKLKTLLDSMLDGEIKQAEYFALSEQDVELVSLLAERQVAIVGDDTTTACE